MCQDTIVKRITTNTTTAISNKLLQLLIEASTVLKSANHESSGVSVTFEYLEAIAKMRYVCFFVAKSRLELSSDCGSQEDNSRLMKQIQIVCQDTNINTRDTGPGIYLVKQLAQQHGLSCLLSLVERMNWIIPDCLKKIDGVNSYNYCYVAITIIVIQSHELFSADPFSIYEDDYCKLRESVHEAVYSNNYDALKKLTKVIFSLAPLYV